MLPHGLRNCRHGPKTRDRRLCGYADGHLTARWSRTFSGNIEPPRIPITWKLAIVVPRLAATTASNVRERMAFVKGIKGGLSRPRMKTNIFRLRSFAKYAVRAICLALLLVVGHRLWRKGQEVTAEYVTLRGIRYVERYVETHQGRWPRSWAELPSDEEVRQYTRIRFDLTAERILEDPSLIYTAVVPITGKFETYPHSKEHFDELLELLKELNAQRETTNSATPKDGLGDTNQ